MIFTDISKHLLLCLSSVSSRLFSIIVFDRMDLLFFWTKVKCKFTDITIFQWNKSGCHWPWTIIIRVLLKTDFDREEKVLSTKIEGERKTSGEEINKKKKTADIGKPTSVSRAISYLYALLTCYRCIRFV